MSRVIDGIRIRAYPFSAVRGLQLNPPLPNSAACARGSRRGSWPAPRPQNVPKQAAKQSQGALGSPAAPRPQPGRGVWCCCRSRASASLSATPSPPLPLPRPAGRSGVMQAALLTGGRPQPRIWTQRAACGFLQARCRGGAGRRRALMARRARAHVPLPHMARTRASVCTWFLHATCLRPIHPGAGRRAQRQHGLGCAAMLAAAYRA